MKSWVKDLKIGSTLFFVSHVRHRHTGETLTVSKVGRKYVYAQCDHRELKIERESGYLNGVNGEIYENQDVYKDAQRRSMLTSRIRINLERGGLIDQLSTADMEAIVGIIEGTLHVRKLKADAARYQAIKKHENAYYEDGDGYAKGLEISFTQWNEDGSCGTGLDPDEYDVVLDQMIVEQGGDV